MTKLAFVTPEGVQIEFTRPGLMARFGAIMLDILVTLAPVIAMVILLAAMRAPGSVIVAVSGLLFLFGRFFYFVLAELAWNGVTLGKRWTGLRVVRTNGTGLTARAIIARNLTREAEVFLPIQLMFAVGSFQGIWNWVALAWIAACIAIPMLNKRNQRLGDIMAGTMVIEAPQAVLMPDLARGSLQDAAFLFLPKHLDHYGAFELHTLERLLRGKSTSDAALQNRNKALQDVVTQIVKKIGWADPVDARDNELFLETFYRAQRAHLEERQLWGDRRADKHVAAEKTGGHG